jgi:hypothetical protein
VPSANATETKEIVADAVATLRTLSRCRHTPDKAPMVHCAPDAAVAAGATHVPGSTSGWFFGPNGIRRHCMSRRRDCIDGEVVCCDERGLARVRHSNIACVRRRYSGSGYNCGNVCFTRLPTMRSHSASTSRHSSVARGKQWPSERTTPIVASRGCCLGAGRTLRVVAPFVARLRPLIPTRRHTPLHAATPCHQ